MTTHTSILLEALRNDPSPEIRGEGALAAFAEARVVLEDDDELM